MLAHQLFGQCSVAVAHGRVDTIMLPGNPQRILMNVCEVGHMALHDAGAVLLDQADDGVVDAGYNLIVEMYVQLENA